LNRLANRVEINFKIKCCFWFISYNKEAQGVGPKSPSNLGNLAPEKGWEKMGKLQYLHIMQKEWKGAKCEL
jgi:hypothetical protein